MNSQHAPRSLRHRPRAVVAAVLLLGGAAATTTAQEPARWKAHDPDRPHPPVVAPPDIALPVPPPADAVVLFDGTDLSRWRAEDGGPAGWAVADGELVPVPGADDIFSVEPFGDVQLHVEWACPLPATGTGQGRGNSGVFFMGLYEVQVLDSWKNETYADGQAAAVYGQFPPLVNVCRPPGQWQAYDIVFRRPRFDRDGTLLKPARLTVLHNGVLVQDAVELWGPTTWLQHQPYRVHPDRLPLSLQDHGSPVRFRNIWLRELNEASEPGPIARDQRPVVALAPADLERYVGRYRPAGSTRSVYTVTRDESQLRCNFYWNDADIDLVPHSPTEFSLRYTAAEVVFTSDATGRVTGFTFHIGGVAIETERIE